MSFWYHEITFFEVNYEGTFSMHPEQKKSYQAMTPEKKLQLALDLYYSAKEIKAAGLKSQHPEWTMLITKGSMPHLLTICNV
jgi:hypothetical protein